MKPLIRAKGRGGFTLIELLIVVALVMVLVLAAATALTTSLENQTKCIKLKKDMADTAERCVSSIRSGGGTDAIAACIKDGQALLDQLCAACGDLPTGTSTAITNANAAIKEYRDALQAQADKDKIVNFKSPC